MLSHHFYRVYPARPPPPPPHTHTELHDHSHHILCWLPSPQSLFRLPETSKEELVRLYYSFDACVVRDFLGKKLSAKNRRDLDDTSEQTGISLKSCRRQFDNIKRILKVVDDLDGSLVENICEQFHLPESMARQYAALVFVSHTRFDTMKRRAQQLPLEDILFCAMEMIDHWTVGAEGKWRAGFIKCAWWRQGCEVGDGCRVDVPVCHSVVSGTLCCPRWSQPDVASSSGPCTGQSDQFQSCSGRVP